TPNYKNVTSLQVTTTLNTGPGNNTLNVVATTGPLIVNDPPANNTFTVGNAGNSLDNIQGAVTLNGQSTADMIILNDQGATSGQSYSLTSNSLTRGTSAPIFFNGIENVVLNASPFGDAITQLGMPQTGTPVAIVGSGSSSTLTVN